MWFNRRGAVFAWASLYLSLVILLLGQTANLSPLKADANGSIVDVDIPALPAPKYDELDDSILSPRSLNERGPRLSCFSDRNIPSDDSENGEDCTPILPGVDKCLKKVREKGKVPARTGLFYTKWDVKTLGIGGQEACKNWATCELGLSPLGVATFDDVIPHTWRLTKSDGIINPFKAEGMTKKEELDDLTDPFGKHVSQAFAESCDEDVYLCIPQYKATNNVWDRDSAWGGWEFPAMTRTSKVQRVYRVAPLNSGTEAGKKKLIWDRSTDQPDTYKPRGSRKSLLQKGLKEEYIRRNWEKYDDNNHK